MSQLFTIEVIRSNNSHLLVGSTGKVFAKVFHKLSGSYDIRLKVIFGKYVVNVFMMPETTHLLFAKDVMDL